MATVDELWAWISPPLQDLAAERAGDHDKSWDELRAGFVSATGQHPFSEDLVQKLDDLSADDRSGLLDDKDRLDEFAYQLARQHADAEPDAGVGAEAPAEGYDEAAWQQYLAENGAQWDGTDGSWSQFMEWFRYYADQKGLAVPANGLLNFLNGQAVPERIATFAQYGVTIAQPQQAAQPAEQAGGSPILPTAADIQISLSEEPEFVALPEDQQAEVVAQVRAALGG